MAHELNYLHTILNNLEPSLKVRTIVPIPDIVINQFWQVLCKSSLKDIRFYLMPPPLKK